MLHTSQLDRFALLHPQLGQHFQGVYPINCLPALPSRGISNAFGLIVNTDTDNLPGQHWIACILLPNGRGEVFDSFGRMPPPRVQLWMNRQCSRGWTFNSTFIQSPFSSICGGYCLFYLYQRLVRNISMNDIVHRLTLSYGAGDTIIKQFLRRHLHV